MRTGDQQRTIIKDRARPPHTKTLGTTNRQAVIPLTPYIPTPQHAHELDLWTRAECYQFYVAQRRMHCTPLERMDLWLRAPCCEECILSDPFHANQLPDISPDNWEVDILWNLGNSALDAIRQEIGDEDLRFTFSCKRCGKELAPWDGDALHVVSYHLEEHYGIPLNTPGRRNPSQKLRNRITKLYRGVCFACGAVGPGLHIDHILPQDTGGDAAFRNLQPLCEACGQKKGDTMPEDVEVWSNE